MKITLILIPALLLFSCKEKTKPLVIKPTTEQIVDYYNRSQPDSIYSMFSGDMKKELPANQTNDFFKQLYKDYGLIKKFTFVSASGAGNRYKTDFENGILWMDVLEDKQGSLDGLRFSPYTGPDEKTGIIRNQTKLALPFNGEWFVFWGGDTKEQNYHVSSASQRHAFDIVIADSSGKTYRTNGKTNEDYYAFGQPIISPCDAEVKAVIEGVPDNIPGIMNPDKLTGNSIVLKTANDEYLLLAHLKMNSVKAKPGDKVKKSQLLGLCGNSGNSSEPHLHFHIQNRDKIEGATGFKCFFENLLVNGEIKNDYSPVKGDRIQNAN